MSHFKIQFFLIVTPDKQQFIKDYVMNAKKMRLDKKHARAELVAPVQARTVQTSMNAKQALITARPTLLVQIFWLVSLASRTADILALQEKDQLVETRLTAKATDAHSRISTNVQTILTTALRLWTATTSCV